VELELDYEHGTPGGTSGYMAAAMKTWRESQGGSWVPIVSVTESNRGIVLYISWGHQWGQGLERDGVSAACLTHVASAVQSFVMACSTVLCRQS
jgi:hypothetical protein